MPSFTFDRTNPRAVEWAEKHAAKLVTDISKTTRTRIREIVVEGFEEQRTVREIAKQIYEELDDKARAMVIARTEVMRASAQGQIEAWAQAVEAGLLTGEEEKEWITTPDDRLAIVGPRSLIATINGWQEVKDIQIGDQVLTHRDRFCKVTHTEAKMYSGPTVYFKLRQRGFHSLHVTYGHPLLVHRAGQDCWVLAESVLSSDEVWITARPCVKCQKLIPFGPWAEVVTGLCHSCNTEEINKERWAKPEEHEKLQHQNERRWSDPEARTKMSARMTGERSPSKRPEVRAKIRSAALTRFLDPEQRAKITEHCRKNTTLPSYTFNKQTPEERDRYRAMALKARAQKSRGMSYLERKMRWFLEKQSIAFEPQWPFRAEGRQFHADFYLPGANIVVECDGPHHLVPEVKARDEVKDAALHGQGIKVLRFDHEAIRKRFTDVANAIQQHCCFIRVSPKIEHRTVNHQVVYHLTVEDDQSFVAGGVIVHNCPICAPMDERRAYIWDDFVGPNGEVIDGPPAHPNCRCSLSLAAPNAKRRVAAGFDPSEARDDHGQWSGSGEASQADRIERAINSHKPFTLEKDQWATKNELLAIHMLQGEGTDDNEPVDVIVRAGGKVFGVEVKTLLDNTNDKITMRKDTLERKQVWAHTNRASLHTLVIDDRKAFGQDDHYSGNRLYYRHGAGSFRLENMIPVRNAEHLRELMRIGKVKRAAGGSGSGNFGHAGRPGEVGGSSPGPRGGGPDPGGAQFSVESIQGPAVSSEEAVAKIDAKFGNQMGQKTLAMMQRVGATLAKDGTIRIGLNPDGDISVSFISRTGPTDGIEMQRLITQNSDGSVDIQHHSFEIPEELQDKGLGTRALAEALDAYEEMNVRTITLIANLDVGGYAWGKLGFQQVERDFTEALDRRLEYYAHPESNARGRVIKFERVGELMNMAIDAGPDAPSVIANEPEGKDIMLGMQWQAVMHLKEPGAAFFKERVREKAREKARSKTRG